MKFVFEPSHESRNLSKIHLSKIIIKLPSRLPLYPLVPSSRTGGSLRNGWKSFQSKREQPGFRTLDLQNSGSTRTPIASAATRTFKSPSAFVLVVQIRISMTSPCIFRFTAATDVVNLLLPGRGWVLWLNEPLRRSSLRGESHVATICTQAQSYADLWINRCEERSERLQLCRFGDVATKEDHWEFATSV